MSNCRATGLRRISQKIFSFGTPAALRTAMLMRKFPTVSRLFLRKKNFSAANK